MMANSALAVAASGKGIEGERVGFVGLRGPYSGWSLDQDKWKELEVD